MNRPAYLLVSHGSRDPRPQLAAEELAWLVSQRLQISPVLPAYSGRGGVGFVTNRLASMSPVLVGTATLELASLPLHQQIEQFVDRARAAGYHTVKLVPLFLLPGVHVMEDIPAEVAQVRQTYPSLAIEQCPYLGSHPQLKNLLTLRSIAPNAQRILLSHGSRRAGGNQPVEAIAAEIDAIPAYWSVSPNLEFQVTKLIQMGCQQIVILPYFLFAGGITDAIDQAVDALSRQFPYGQLHLAEPLGASAAMADLVVDLVQ